MNDNEQTSARTCQSPLWSNRLKSLCAILCMALGTGCATRDVPQAHRAMLYNRTGALALYGGAKGFDNTVRGPGTEFLGLYNELRLVDCGQTTLTESLDTLTKDGVHFGFDLAVRFSADCSDEAVKKLIASMAPDVEDTITAKQLFATFIQPSIGEAAREYVSPIRANELNDRQAEIMAGIKKRFFELIKTRERNLVLVYEVNLKNLHFPPQMDQANLERASQAVLRDKAIAERERVTAEIETMRMRKELSEREAESISVKIDIIGAALRRNPEFLQYDLQLKMPEIYREAGVRGNMVLAAPNPLQLPLAVQPQPQAAPVAAPAAPKKR
jgi:SPFH domain / Band 7 family